MPLLSSYVAEIVRALIRRLLRRVQDERDLAAINARADITNQESDALLDLQSWPG